MDNLHERVLAMVSRVSDLKRSRDAADELVDTLEKERTLPDKAKSALTAYKQKKKA